MNENKKIARLYVFLAAIIASVAVVFQYILSVNYIESDTGVYMQGVQTPSAFYFFIFIATVLMATPAFIFRKDLLSKDLKRGTAFTAISSILSAGTMIFASALFFVGKNNVFVIGSSSNVIGNLKLACSILGFVVAIYYFCVTFLGRSKSDFVSFMSFFPVIWTLLFLMCLYFDRSGFLNSPIKVFRQLALIVFMLYELFEARAMLGKSKPIIYFMLSNLSVIFLSAAFVPEIILLIQGKLQMSVDVSYSLYCGVAVIYVLSRSVAFAESSNGDSVIQKKKVSSKAKPKDDLFTPDEDLE